MCRLLAYLGPAIQLDQVLCKPEHSLIVQSYRPKEMREALLNADGFGLGWYHQTQTTEPFTYKSTQPIWSDINLRSLSRYIESPCILSYVRSATPGQAVDLINCQPFPHQQLLFIHNGYIDHFRKTLYRPLRSHLSDHIYQNIHGTTDSEHIFALVLNELTASPEVPSLHDALEKALKTLISLARTKDVKFLANTIISDGKQLVASRLAQKSPAPSLYWLRDDPSFPDAVILASEPLFSADWHLCPENHLIHVGTNLEINCYPLIP